MNLNHGTVTVRVTVPARQSVESPRPTGMPHCSSSSARSWPRWYASAGPLPGRRGRRPGTGVSASHLASGLPCQPRPLGPASGRMGKPGLAGCSRSHGGVLSDSDCPTRNMKSKDCVTVGRILIIKIVKTFHPSRLEDFKYVSLSPSLRAMSVANWWFACNLFAATVLLASKISVVAVKVPM